MVNENRQLLSVSWRWRRAAHQSGLFLSFYYSACSEWPAGSLTRIGNQPVRLSIPPLRAEARSGEEADLARRCFGCN